MRTLAIVLLFSALASAQDDGVSLFYKGFWLEQAEGKLDEAKALYGKLLSEKPDAPEAPRALLGLVRIRLARGEDAGELVAELERRYPAAKDEIAAAQRFAGRRPNSFVEPVREGDSGVERKIKDLYSDMRASAQISQDDTRFLTDLGTVAHPMLAALLRSTEPVPVKQATQVLLLQRTPEAYSVLAGALLDDSAVFRAVMVEALRECWTAPPLLVEALERLYGAAAPRLRAEVVKRLASMATAGGEGRERAYALLLRALGDEDPEVRWAAVVFGGPDAYVDALLRRLEAKDGALGGVSLELLRLADRDAFRDRIAAIVDAYPINWGGALPDPENEAGALILARRVVRELKAGNREGGVYTLAYRCAGASPEAAANLLHVALELDDKGVSGNVFGGMGQQDQVQYLGDRAPALRAAALELAPAPGEKDRAVVASVIKALGLGAADLQTIHQSLRKRGPRGVPALLLDDDRIEPLGPAQGGALVSYCTDGRQVAELLHAGRRFAEREDSGVEFFRQVVPRAGPEAHQSLRDLAEDPELAAIVAERLLVATGAEWGWTVEGQPPQPRRGDPGPFIWSRLDKAALGKPPLVALLVTRVEDPRREIAMAAASAAASDLTENGTAALRRALVSKRREASAIALRALAARGPDGPRVVREFAARKGLSADDRGAVAGAVRSAKDPAVTAVAAELLRAGTEWDLLWGTYAELAPKEAVELAIERQPHTEESLRVLVGCDYPQRIEIFRAVLRGTDRRAIGVVLAAVHDQYLVELGEETLLQLRSPDAVLRETASKAIERLKFYAEARKAFEK